MFPFTLQQLKILKAIATERSFTKAAKNLYISQPAISKQIRTLEKNLDVILLEREKNKISLTENGKILLQYSERILALCEESCRALVDLKNGGRGNLTIGASEIIGTYLIPQIITFFTQNYPQINLKVIVNSTSVLTNSVLTKKIDLAIVEGKISSKSEKNLRIKTFVNEEINLIIPKSHPYIKKNKISKEDLYYLNFITLNSDSNLGKLINTILIQNQIEIKQLKIIMQFSSIEAIKTAVRLGLGVAFIPSLIIEKEVKLDLVRILKIDDNCIFRTLSIISNPDYNKSKSLEYFYKELLFLKDKLEY